MRHVRRKAQEQESGGQEGTACGLRRQDELQSQDGGRCRWTVRADKPKK